MRRPERMYVDSGDTNDGEVETRQLEAALTGWPGFDYVEQPGAYHHEKFWAQRLPGALAWLFPQR